MGASDLGAVRELAELVRIISDGRLSPDQLAAVPDRSRDLPANQFGHPDRRAARGRSPPAECRRAPEPGWLSGHPNSFRQRRHPCRSSVRQAARDGAPARGGSYRDKPRTIRNCHGPATLAGLVCRRVTVHRLRPWLRERERDATLTQNCPPTDRDFTHAISGGRLPN